MPNEDVEMPADRLSERDGNVAGAEYVEAAKRVAFAGMPERHGSLADRAEAGDRAPAKRAPEPPRRPPAE